MGPELKILLNPGWKPGRTAAGESLIDPGALAEVHRFHRSMPGYAPTPLHRLPRLAETLGLGTLAVKDESPRFGLNAFKVLGAGYAVAKVLARRLGRPLDELPFPALASPEVRRALPGLVFAATTDGNHGRGVAWTAAQLGFPATIYMPKGTSASRLENIRRLGQAAEITPWNYDDTVRWVAAQAADQGWEVVQDTAWEGYVDVPRWIMQGYATVARETGTQWTGAPPTHVFLQAGVGAFAAVMAAALLDAWKDAPPRVVILEGRPAECFYESVAAGRKTSVGGDLGTIMAGLACGEPNPLAWDVLRDAGFAFVAAPDETAALGMRVLGNPVGDDPRIVSGESGAVGPGVLAWLARPEHRERRAELGLDGTSRVLCFSTEGDTDPVMYRKIVWEGAYHG